MIKFPWIKPGRVEAEDLPDVPSKNEALAALHRAELEAEKTQELKETQRRISDAFVDAVISGMRKASSG